MKRRTKDRLLIYEPGRDQIETLVAALNNSSIEVATISAEGVEGRETVIYPEFQESLRHLVSRWLDSGPNIDELLRGDRNLRWATAHGRTVLIPSLNEPARGHLLWAPEPRFNNTQYKDQVLQVFMQLIVNPEWYRLGGPCDRCRRYYVRKTIRQKRFCSRRCSASATAVASTRTRRENEHLAKLEKAALAIRRWEKGARGGKWKTWVARKSGLSVKWLTRAVNNAELNAPIPNE